MPQVADPGAALRTLYTVSIGSRSSLGAFVLIAGQVGDELQALADEPPWRRLRRRHLLWGVFSLQDAALTGLRQAHWVPVENAIFGVLKLALPPALLAWRRARVFVGWVWPMRSCSCRSTP